MLEIQTFEMEKTEIEAFMSDESNPAAEMPARQTRLDEIAAAVEKLNTKAYLKSKTDFDKADAALTKLYTAQQKRLEKEENERLQRELEEQTAEANRKMLENVFKKLLLEKELERTDLDEEERADI